MCLLKIAEHVCECIYEQTKHRLVVVLASELTLLSYINVSSVIPREKRHFLPSKSILGNPQIIIYRGASFWFSRCYEQWISENYNWILFIAVSILQRTKDRYSRVFTLFTIELALFVESRLALIMCSMDAGYLSFAYQQFSLLYKILLRRKREHCYIYCIYSNALQNTFIMEANTMILRDEGGFILFAINATKLHKQIKRAENNCCRV